MKIIETINNEELSGKEKLKAIKSMVKTCRSEYGNEDVEITGVKVNSVNGMVTVSLLTTDEKVAVAEQEIRRCISQATAVSENVEGSIFDKAYEFAVACNPLLTNIGEKSTSKY